MGGGCVLVCNLTILRDSATIMLLFAAFFLVYIVSQEGNTCLSFFYACHLGTLSPGDANLTDSAQGWQKAYPMPCAHLARL